MSEMPTGVRYRPYPIRAVVCPSAPLGARPPQTLASGDPSAELHTSQWRGRMPVTNQLPSLYSVARPRSTQEPSYHHMPVQLGVGQGFVYQGTRGGSSGSQIPFNPHHGTHPVPHSGGPRLLHPDYNIPMINMPDIQRQLLADLHAAQESHQGHQGITGWHPHLTQLLGACALQSSPQAAMPPQQSPSKHDLSKLSTATAQLSQPVSVVSFEDASSTTSSALEETGSKEAALVTATCPLPECKPSCGRLQELERHLRELHLPHDIYCQELGCDWTGNRRYALQNHLAGKHPDIPMPEQEAFTIYDSRSLVKRLLNEEISVEQAVHEACSSFEEKARSVRKEGLWRPMRGH